MFKSSAKWSHSCSVRNLTLNCVLRPFGNVLGLTFISWASKPALSIMRIVKSPRSPWREAREAGGGLPRLSKAEWWKENGIDFFSRYNFLSLFFHISTSFIWVKIPQAQKGRHRRPLSPMLSSAVSLQATRPTRSWANLQMYPVPVLQCLSNSLPIVILHLLYGSSQVSLNCISPVVGAAGNAFWYFKEHL